MKVIFNDPIDMQRALHIYELFTTELPPDHKSCMYVSEWFEHFVKRTKAGNIVVNQWRRNQ